MTNKRTETDLMDLRSHNFHIAFAVETIIGQDMIPIHDQDFVEWVPHFETTYGDGTSNRTIISSHKCTKEDYAKFSDPTLADEESVNLMKEKNALFCLDENDKFGKPIDFNVYKGGVKSRSLVLLYRPCVPRLRTPENNATEKCLMDEPDNKTQL